MRRRTRSGRHAGVADTQELRLFGDDPPAALPAGGLPTPVAPQPPTAPQPPAEQHIAPPKVAAPPFSVLLQRSAKRKRTVGARLEGDVLHVTVPTWMSAAEREHWVGVMTKRFERSVSIERIDLAGRAKVLATRHDLRRPTEIRWSDDMLHRWGSCTPHTGTIRISTRLATFPDWVIDYVIVHELAHLSVGGHGDDFWQLVQRYPKAERAIGYLIAKSNDGETE